MGKKIDMTGWIMKEHGVSDSLLTVIKEDKDYKKENNIKSRETYWQCLCKCGTIKTILGRSLREGKTKSCGCENKREIVDLTGKKFGQLTVLSITDKRIRGSVVWLCKCSCGNIAEVTSQNLLSNQTKSCGCLIYQKLKTNFKDNSNLQFGKLTAISPLEKRKYGSVVWKCKCECGNFIEVSSHNLVTGSTQSCGCLISKGEEKILKILQENNILFERQKFFESCRLSTSYPPLRFDFYINNSFLLEFDGKQHYKYDKTGWNNKQNFLKIQERDNFKNQWCKNNGIKLKRIPYWALKSLTLEDILSDKYTI